MPRQGDLCIKCKKRPVEVIDGEAQWQCIPCNDRDIEHANERAEWNYYHPGEK